MSKAGRKLKRKQKRETKPPANGKIAKLSNPHTDNFEAFIVGNAMQCERVVEENSHLGQHLVLCGAGPSLRDHADEWCPQADQIWGCNSALLWLHDNGHKPTHGFTVDQGEQMVTEWADAPDVEYLIASTVHPLLIEHMQAKRLRMSMFNNYVGIKKRPVSYCACGHDKSDHKKGGCVRCDCDGYDMRMMGYEDWLYAALSGRNENFKTTVRAGSGLNSVTRAIDVAQYMGFSRITVLGADCALRVTRPFVGVHGSPEHHTWLRDETEMHADGGNALASGATPVTFGGDIDCWRPLSWKERLLSWPWRPWRARVYGPRWWETKPDMMITAVWLVRMSRALGEGFTIIGDTLPNAIIDKPDEFLDQLPALAGSDGKAIKYPMPQEGLGSAVDGQGGAP